VSVATTPDRVWSVLLKHASVLLFTVVKWFDWIVISDFMHPSYHLTAAAYPAGCMLVAHRLYLWAGGGVHLIVPTGHQNQNLWPDPIGPAVHY
jgi:hypothetical protein